MTINPPGVVPRTPDQITDPQETNQTNSHTSGHTRPQEAGPAATVEISSKSSQTGKHNHQER